MTPVAPTVEISAVMPAYNEEANLEQSVGRMARALQTFTRGFEIVVVDDGSQDGTAAVLERLKAEYPTWSDDELFDHARLVIAALLAKIHTVEWTPGILGHAALQIAMRANWWGLQQAAVSLLLGRLCDSGAVALVGVVLLAGAGLGLLLATH